MSGVMTRLDGQITYEIPVRVVTITEDTVLLQLRDGSGTTLRLGEQMVIHGTIDVSKGR